MNYYIYENWRAADREGPKIHKWNCGYCHMGFGMRPNANRGENGVWIGPFENIEYARAYYLIKFGAPLIECNCVNN